MATKICPLKFNERTLDNEGYPKDHSCLCQAGGCAFWNDQLEICGLIVDGYLKGIETARREQ